MKHLPDPAITSLAIVLIVVPTLFLIGSRPLIHYEGTKWTNERSALDLVLEYGDQYHNEFEIVGEGNSVELKYDFETVDELDGFDINTHREKSDILFWDWVLPGLRIFGFILLSITVLVAVTGVDLYKKDNNEHS